MGGNERAPTKQEQNGVLKAEKTTPPQNRNVLTPFFLKKTPALKSVKKMQSKMGHFFVAQICRYRNQQKCASTEMCLRPPALGN